MAAIDRAQRSRGFRIVASIALLLVGIAGMGTYIVTRASGDAVESQFDQMAPKPGADASAEERAMFERQRSAAEETAAAINRVLAARADPTSVAVGIGALTLIAVCVVWLGIGLWSLLVVIALAAVAWPLIQWGEGGWRDAGLFIAAVGSLSFSFIVLMEMLKLLLSGPWAVTAIARNVVIEAVRMKVSLVFIVLLLLALAALPGQLDPETPLRYRVQSFLQYGTGGTFWIIALLVLFLSVGTVAFEQRDKVIWQTMTKPVASWQYLLGKWLGVVGVAAVLLTVSSTGVFLFVGYLREQRAVGEFRPFISAGNEFIAEDRLILETQVLTARQSVRPSLPTLDFDAVKAEIDERIERMRRGDPMFRETAEERGRIMQEIYREHRDAMLAIAPGGREVFAFQGLERAKERAESLTFRYRVDAGGNDPRALVKLTFVSDNMLPVVQVIPPGQTITLNLNPASIRSDGMLVLQVINGDALKGLEFPESDWANTETVSFPPDGIEIYFPVSSYRANFVRVMLVLLMKLAFLAMVGVWAATHLSFAVACLVAFGVFLMAESAGFLTESLEYYASRGDKDEILWTRVVIRAIAVPVSFAFNFYSNLRPTQHLVEGRLLGWGAVSTGVVVLGALTSVLYAMGVMIFRRRELATYSGQ
jgi:ABC-type transport system involved in multi-copper enzyme maturation permease subunit